MPVAKRVLCALYGTIAALGLVGTWIHNAAYFPLGLLNILPVFMQDMAVTPASRSISLDLMFLALAVVVWMVVEARRLALRGVWLYVIGGLIVGISVTVPLFLIARERALAADPARAAADTLRAADVLGFIALAAGVFAYAVFTFVG